MEPVEGFVLGAGRYRLEQRLGRGGMGLVWLAEDTALGEWVALKLLPSDVAADDAALEDLRKETRKSRRLTHPHIVRIHEFVHFEGEPPFVTMEYVDGANLSQLRLRQPDGVFGWEQLTGIAEELCDALDHAHGEGVVHRDIKPGNLMVNSNGYLRVADFGIAATVNEAEQRISLRQAASGTATHMSPQQMTGAPPTPADDVYSLGATLYELVTGRPPFFRGNVPYQVQNVVPERIEDRLLEVGIQNPLPGQVSATIMACLQKAPDARPASVRVVAHWLGLRMPDGVNTADLPLPPDSDDADSSISSKRKHFFRRKALWWAGIILLILLLALALQFALEGLES